MKTSCNIILDTRRIKDDGTYPLIIRLNHNGRSTSIPLNISVRKEEWNDQGKKITKKVKDVTDIDRINNIIWQEYVACNDKILELRDKKMLERLSVTELKHLLVNKRIEVKFCNYAYQLADEYEKNGYFGNASVYRQTANFVKKNNNDSDIPFYQITHQFLKKAEQKYLAPDPVTGKARQRNGLSFYMRTIRAIYNKAIIDLKIPPDYNPFFGYTISHEDTEKRAVSKDVIKMLEELYLDVQTSIWHAKNFFLFSFYTRGMNFMDMAKLQMKNIIDNRIIYKRSKSRFRKVYSIEINERIKKILDIYFQEIDVKNPDSYIFGIIVRDGAKEQRMDIESARSNYNKQLKKIQQLLKIPNTLSSYVARHTWASAAKKLHFSTEIIGEGLGHTDTKTTEIYLDKFDDEVLDKANEEITSTSSISSDTIVTKNKEILCSVKEIGTDYVKFNYPKEDLINYLPKAKIIKIILRNGRVENFDE
jgi:integrase